MRERHTSTKGRMMIYRGFKIDCFSPDAPTDQSARLAAPGAAWYVEFKVMEPQPTAQWREIGVANDLAIAREMIDRLIHARQHFLQVVGYSMHTALP